jgi:hypothetical protein
MALRDVRQGRDCIQRQLKVIATLRDRGLPTDQAEAILRWLEERQRQFEDHYNRALYDGLRRLELRKAGGNRSLTVEQNKRFASSRSLS